MDWIFHPAVTMYLRFTNIARFPIAGSFFLIPLAIAVYRGYPQLSAGALAGIAATLLLAFYFLAGLFYSSKYGWGIIEGLAQRINECDLQRTREDERHNLLRGQFGRMYRTLNQARDNLREIVGQVRASAGVINGGTKEIAAGAQNLSHRTEQQATTLEETASGIEELAAAAKQNAENCQLASGLSKSATEVAKKVARTVNEAVDSMGLIDKSSRRIADIIGVIEGIAFQTNILALNAAVEAARAGERGRGFAVVAGEVRSLAQRSAQAAREIKALIEESAGNVTEGGKLVGEAGRTIDEIVVGAEQVTRLMSEIAVASREQSAGIEEINKAIVQMENTTQQNAALVEQASASTLSFEEESRRLIEVVGKFRLDPEADLSPAQLVVDRPPLPRAGGPKGLPKRSEFG
jgi:methyl-accepting chemotaxis protein